MDWNRGCQQASGEGSQMPIVDEQNNWELPLDFALGQSMDFTPNSQNNHVQGFESFDLNFGASSAPYTFGDFSIPTQSSISQQGTVDPTLLSQHNWPSSETDSTSSSFDGHSSGFEKHSSTSSLATYSTNSSSYSQNPEGDSFNTSKPNKRRYCERTMEDPVPQGAQVQLVYPADMLSLEPNQTAISIFESWLSACPSIYPEDSEFSNLAALTKIDAGVVKSWFVARLRAHRMDRANSMFEDWLDSYPLVYPGDEEFRSLAGLTRLSLDTVRLWFAQKLRCKTSTTLSSDPLSAAGSFGYEPAVSRTAAFPAMVAPQQSSILQRAASWVKEEREPKCEASQDQSLLLRDDNKPFQCTRKCGKKFRDRDDWRKHEEVNWPQEGWVCDLPASVVVAGIRICTHCGKPNPEMDHFQTHKKAICSNKPFTARGRLHHRKQHFLQHFDNLHPHVPCDDYVRSSHFSVDSNFPRRCGFCSHRFIHWKDRVEHIGVHFHDEGKDMTQWNDRSEADDGSGNPKDDKGGEDDDRNPDDASDSDDDDSDDLPPRSAPKKRVQARASRSKRQSSTTAASYTNGSIQSGLHIPQEEDKPYLLRRPRTEISPLHSLLSSSRPTIVARGRSTPLHTVERSLDPLQTPQHARPSIARPALKPQSRTLDATQEPLEDLPQPMRSDEKLPAPNRGENAVPNDPLSDKVYDSITACGTAAFHDKKHSSSSQNQRISWIMIVFLILYIPLFIGGMSMRMMLRSGSTVAAYETWSNEYSGLSTPSSLPQSPVMSVPESRIGDAEVLSVNYFSIADSMSYTPAPMPELPALDSVVLDSFVELCMYFVKNNHALPIAAPEPLNNSWPELRDEDTPSSDSRQSTPSADQKMSTYPQSHLALMTRLKGISYWLNSQDVDNQLSNFGLDDDGFEDYGFGEYDDLLVGAARTRKLIGSSRWWTLNEGSEVLEVFTQTSGAALHRRVYMDSVWTSDFDASNWSIFDVTARQWRTVDSMKLLTPGNISALWNLFLIFSAHPGSNFSTGALWNCSTICFLGNLSALFVETLASDDAGNFTTTTFSSFWLDITSGTAIRWPFKTTDMADNGNETVIIVKSRDARQEDAVQSDSGQCAAGSSSYSSCLAQNLDSGWSAIPGPGIILCAFTFLAVLCLNVIFCITEIFCFGGNFMPGLLTTTTLNLLELIITMALPIWYMANIHLFSEWNMGEYLVLTGRIFAAFRFRTYCMKYLGKWVAYTPGLLILSHLIWAMVPPIFMATQWAQPVCVFVLPAVVFCLTIPRMSKAQLEAKIASARTLPVESSFVPSKTEYSCRLTNLGLTWQYIVHLLPNPIDFLWTRAAALARTPYQVKTINDRTLNDMYEANPRERMASRVFRFGDLATESDDDNIFPLLASTTEPPHHIFCQPRSILKRLSDATSSGGQLLPLVSPILGFMIPRSISLNWTTSIMAWCGFDTPDANEMIKIGLSVNNTWRWRFIIGSAALAGINLRNSRYQKPLRLFVAIAIVIPFTFVDRDVLLSDTALLVLNISGALASCLVWGLIVWQYMKFHSLMRKHYGLEHSIKVASLSKRNTSIQDPDTRTHSSTSDDQSPNHSNQSHMMSMQKSGNDIGVVSWNIDPTTDIGAWAGENTSGDGYPLALTDLDVSIPSSGETYPAPGITAKRYVHA
ncbi:hypothetical protein V8E51_008759 [Hyaloscypha variabilis]